MAGYRVISSDSHVFEPADLWSSRIEPKYRDRCPRIVRTDDGSDWWYCDGLQGQGVGGGAQVGIRFEEPDKLSHRDVIENVRPGGYVPEEHIKDMDLDGIDVGIIYPTAGLHHYKVVDGELVTAVFRTYNDWLGEFCQADPERLKGIAMVNVDDVKAGATELERCVKLGMAGAMIPVYLPDGKSYSSPEYEVLWSTAQGAGMTLAFHIGTNRSSSRDTARVGVDTTPGAYANLDYWVRETLADLIFNGVFERFPGLKIVAVEHELAWAAHFLEQMDYTYNQRPPGDDWKRFNNDMLPSDFFHRNVFLSFQESALGVRLRDVIGVDNLLWGSDYPHFESTFPRSREILGELLAGCTDEEKAKIAGGNAARVYHID